MAACTFRVGTADTGATPNASGAFTPALNDLLVVLVVASDISGANAASATLTSSIGGFTFSQITFTSFRANADKIYLFVANALVSNTASQTVSFQNSADEATGSHIFVFSVSGMTFTGTAAVRQTAATPNVGGGSTPSATFAASALTGNPTLGCIGNSANPATVTPPTNWTEPASGDLGYNNPTTGGEVCFRDSGFTGTTITWGSSVASNYAVLIVELDASAAAGQPAIRRQGRRDIGRSGVTTW